jgi:hypothetical protein
LISARRFGRRFIRIGDCRRKTYPSMLG